MPKKYKNVCNSCGMEARKLTYLKKYGREPEIPKLAVSSYYKGKCDFCGIVTDITRVGDFFNPNFRLLRTKLRKEAKREKNKTNNG